MQIQGTSPNSASLNNARVNKEGQLLTRTIAATETQYSVDEGDGFQAYTGVITLADADRTSILYLENNDEADIILTSATIGSRPSTGGVDNVLLIESVGNVLASDGIVTGGSDALITNRNGGAARKFDGVAKKGPATAAANGVAGSGELSDFTVAQQIELTQIVPRGGSVSLEAVPPAGNTGMDITVTVAFHVIKAI